MSHRGHLCHVVRHRRRDRRSMRLLIPLRNITKMSGEAFSLATKKPVIAQYGPYEVQVQKGKMYYWCACGRSKTQPFCTEPTEN